jgi:single-stranded-DNA-specific exonuclease
MKVRLKNEPIKSNYVNELLISRGVEDVDKFLHPTFECVQTCYDLNNICKGVDLIADLAPDARVGLIVDCDVDGYTSAAIIYKFLKRLYPKININSYIHDGKAHGLEEHWEYIRDANYDLVIIPDAGSNDSKYATEINCPILVLDHHIVEDTNFSSNMTVINNQLSEEYKNKSLSGAGVVWQFCYALDQAFNGSDDWVMDYVDLAALGICADMMSGLEIENQWFWHEGFSHVQNPFFMAIALKQAYSITGKMNATWGEIQEALNPTSVAFYIVPMINAMVRVGTEEEKARMFLAFTDGHQMIPCNKRGAKGTLEEACIESVRECVNARSKQNKIKDNAVAHLEQKIFKHDLLENKILFVRLDDDDDFPAELNGLVAMQLSVKYKRPTIVARLNDEGYVRGSSRGLNNSELTSFKKYMDSTGLFEYTAGHDNACGISILNSNLSKLHEQANHDLSTYNFGDGYYEVNFERQALSDDLSALIEDLTKYKNIWSQGNDEPMIYVRDLHVSKKDIQIMGKNKDTIKIVKNGIAYMKFFAKDLIEELNNYSDDIKLEVVGKANLNNWMGQITPQIFIENYEIKEDKLIDF